MTKNVYDTNPTQEETEPETESKTEAEPCDWLGWRSREIHWKNMQMLSWHMHRVTGIENQKLGIETGVWSLDQKLQMKFKLKELTFKG